MLLKSFIPPGDTSPTEADFLVFVGSITFEELLYVFFVLLVFLNASIALLTFYGSGIVIVYGVSIFSSYIALIDLFIDFYWLSIDFFL